jgi:pimeloyl-ACP methyl ester carboxylesterase
MTPLKQGRKLALMIPHSTVTEIVGAGHMLPSENPDEVNVPLARFLAL